MRSTHLSGAHRSFPVSMAFLACFALGAAVPAAAAHKARLSADLADHVPAGSPAIDVIVHGTRQEVEALARRYNLRVRKLLRSGAVLRVTAGELEALQQDDRGRPSVGGHPLPFERPTSSHSRSAPIRYGRALACSAASTGRGIGVAVIDSGVDPRHCGAGRPCRRLGGFHRRRRRRSLRPRHARRGDDCRGGGPPGGDARLPRHRAWGAHRQPARAR